MKLASRLTEFNIHQKLDAERHNKRHALHPQQQVPALLLPRQPETFELPGRQPTHRQVERVRVHWQLSAARTPERKLEKVKRLRFVITDVFFRVLKFVLTFEISLTVTKTEQLVLFLFD